MLASFILSLAVLGAHAATTVDLTPSDVSFSSGWTNETTRDGANSFLQAGEFLCGMTAPLPPSASSVTYFGFSSPGAQYGYTVDCAVDCVVTRVNGTDDDDDSSASEVFSVSDLDPSVNHTLRVYNLGTDDSKINFDRLSVLVEDNAANSQDPSAGITPPVAVSSTTTTPRSTAASLRVQSSSASSGSGPSPSSKNTANPDASATTSNTDSDSSSPASPSTSGTDGSSSSAAASSSGGSPVSIRLVAGLTVFAVVVTAGVLVVLFLCLRRRRRAYTASSGSGQPPSPTSSIIPIMDPPPPHMSMRVSGGFPNPFADPNPASEPVAMFPDPYAVPQMSQPAPVHVPFVSPMAAVMQQRRQRSDSASRGASPSSSAPTIPLPELPAGARLRDGGDGGYAYGYGGRSDSPASSNNTQNNPNGLWIARTPVKSHFSFAV